MCLKSLGVLYCERTFDRAFVHGQCKVRMLSTNVKIRHFILRYDFMKYPESDAEKPPWIT